MRRRVLPLVLILVAFGLGGTLYRSWSIGYPLVPRITERVWAARLGLEWDAPAVVLDVALPPETREQGLRDERIVSGPLQATIAPEPGGERRLRLTGSGAKRAGYEADLTVRRPGASALGAASELPGSWRQIDEFTPRAVAAARRLAAALPAAEAPRRCFDLVTEPAVAADVADLLSGTASPVEALVLCWRAAGLPARIAQFLPLKPGSYPRTEVLAEIFREGRWTAADPVRIQYPAPARERLLWAYGLQPIVRSEGRIPIAWQIDLRQRPLTHWTDFSQITAGQSTFFARWSLFTLPPNAQELFRILLLVPVGALIVAVLRNVVGMNTFGTFMPILIAIAFRQTQLAVGLGLFAAVVGVGYGVRFSLDRWKLLLVPRLSVILTFVIGSLAGLALLAHRWNFHNVAGVGLLPMVILTMTIERFFVVAEESGGRAALRIAASTGGVAAIAYGILSWEYLQLVFFTYPELLLVVAGLQIALGRYVGFRLSELLRFRRLTEAP
jgi:hypothetical protein